MVNKTLLHNILSEIYLRHSNWFCTSNSKPENYINIDLNTGEITFKPGLIPNTEIFEDIRMALQINKSPCYETYPKKQAFTN